MPTVASPAPECAQGRAQGRRPHLDLHRVLRLRFLGVQELNGHNHLPFALKEHHLGKAGTKPEATEQSKLTQDEVKSSSINHLCQPLGLDPSSRDHVLGTHLMGPVVPSEARTSIQRPSQGSTCDWTGRESHGSVQSCPPGQNTMAGPSCFGHSPCTPSLTWD